MRYQCRPDCGSSVCVNCGGSPASVAQFIAPSVTYSGTELLTLEIDFVDGSAIIPNTDSETITLRSGCVFEVFYHINAVTPAGATVTVTPVVDGVSQSIFSSSATTGTSTETLTLNGSFLLATSNLTNLTFSVFTDSASGISVTGNIYIIQQRAR